MAQLKPTIINGRPTLVVSDKIIDWRLRKLAKKLSNILNVRRDKIQVSISVSVDIGEGSEQIRI